MDSSKLIEMKRQAANQYLARNQASAGNALKDASMLTHRNKMIGSVGGSVGAFNQSNYMNAPCINCPTVPNPASIAASGYGDSRLDAASFAGMNTISYDSVQFRRAGLAICCNNIPATTPPLGIFTSTCACISYPPSSTYTPPCVPGYNQTPHFVNTPCCPKPSTLLSWPVRPCN